MIKVYGVLAGQVAYFGEAVAVDDNKLYVELNPDKMGRKPILEVENFEGKVILNEE